MPSVLTINAALQDVRFLSRSFYRPLGYIQDRLVGLANAVKNLQPDVICIQELFHHDLQQAFYTYLAGDYPHAAGFGRKGLKWRLDNELITLSRFPLSKARFIRFQNAAIEEKIFINRGMMTMEIDLPSVGRVRFVNVHMTAGGLRRHPEDPRMETVRTSQIRQLLESIPTTMPTVIAGDFNAGPDSSPENYRQLLTGGMIDTFVAAGGRGISWDPANPLVAVDPGACLPPQRVDHVLMNEAAGKIFNVENAKIVMSESCLPVEDNRMIPVSDHYGVLVHFTVR